MTRNEMYRCRMQGGLFRRGGGLLRCGAFILPGLIGILLFPTAGYADGGHTHESFTLARFIVPMGITTLALVTVTVALGFFRRFRPKAFLAWHKRFGLAALIAGAIHATLVLLLH